MKVAQGFGLLDFFHSGKYINCRVDSIVESDPEYILYTFKKYMYNYTKDVLDAAERIVQTNNDQRHNDEEVKPFAAPHPFFSDWDDDIPF